MLILIPSRGGRARQSAVARHRPPVAQVSRQHLSDLGIVAAGTHPLAIWPGQKATRTPHYDAVMADLQNHRPRRPLCERAEEGHIWFARQRWSPDPPAPGRSPASQAPVDATRPGPRVKDTRPFLRPAMCKMINAGQKSRYKDARTLYADCWPSPRRPARP